ncbi:MAG: cysteine desulfurase CsdA [Gammaproteobacteria bacterium]|nr:MAG: cysteine desulfurase CsdA [Gammaproteobacteria bacterium]
MLNPKQLQEIRQSFAFFNRKISSDTVIYFDNAATTQKLSVVLDCLTELWTEGSANVHRSSHGRANQLTQRFEKARSYAASFINAEHSSEVIWTTGATEGINLVANSWGNAQIHAGDQILISAMEHHANILPWQQLCERRGAELKIIPLTDNSELDLDALDSLLSEKIKLLAITHVSNVLGTINPIKKIVEKCQTYPCKVLVDGAQAAAHIPIDVQDLNCDFYVFSGHKCFAPEATGVLYGKKQLLTSMPVWKVGGEMVKTVTFNSAEFQAPPLRFEAGTPNISGVIAFAEALNFLKKLDQDALAHHEQSLRQLLEHHLSKIQGIEIYSRAKNRCSLVTFSIKGCESMDIATLLSEQNIAVRSGQLCAMPLVKSYHPNGVLRVSLAFYNSEQEVSQFMKALLVAIELLRE